MSEKHKSHIGRATKQEHLPAGYQRIASFSSDFTEDQRKNFGNYVVRTVHKGCFDNGDDFNDTPFCLGGRAEDYAGGTFYLHPEDLKRLRSEFVKDRDPPLHTLSNQTDSGSQYESAVTALCEINNGITVLGDTLRDVLAAVQLLAEQQAKVVEQQAKHRDLLATANGFHS
jgi:hypothetical protein